MSDQRQQNSVAERLYYLRHTVARLTRREVAEKYDIPSVTLKFWESGRATLTKKAIERCIHMFRQENIVVTEEWLCNGEGVEPKFSLDMHRYFSGDNSYSIEESNQSWQTNETSGSTYTISRLDDDGSILQDVHYFRTQYEDAIVHLVTNDDMLPLYAAGDHVGGRAYSNEALTAALNKVCIVTLKDGQILLRQLFSVDGAYNLACLNPHISIAQPVLYNVDIVSAAPIIWHRRPENT